MYLCGNLLAVPTICCILLMTCDSRAFFNCSEWIVSTCTVRSTAFATAAGCGVFCVLWSWVQVLQRYGRNSDGSGFDWRDTA